MNTNPKMFNLNRFLPGMARLRWMKILAVLLVIIVAWILISAIWNRPGKADEGGSVFVVKRGPLTISVTESGTIQNRDQEVIKSQVEGRTTILWIIPEATQVKKGELLIQLDSSKLEDNKVQQQTSVLNAEAAFIRVRENLAVTKSQGKSDIAEAYLAHKFAKLDLNKYLEGEYPQELAQAEAQITIAREELSRAEQKRDWSRRLAKGGYLTDTELQADELAFKRSDLDVKLAKGKLKVLKEYTHPRQKEQLESDIIQAEQALERVRRRANADEIQAEADLTAKQAEHLRKQGTLNKIIDQIAKCRITAPVAGMVVYSTSGKGSWRGNVEPLDEGQEVRERQDLIYLPTTTSMMVEVKIHESSLRKVKTDMPVVISCNALPDKIFAGRVGKIGLLPDAQSMWMNPDLKVFSTEIYLDGNGGTLQPGMTCRAEIIVAKYTDALYVPIQCVLRVGGKPTVYVRTAEGSEPREVQLGLDNNRMIHITSGLQVGEKILLAPPLAPSTVGAEIPSPIESKVGQSPGKDSDKPVGSEGTKPPGPGNNDRRSDPNKSGKRSEGETKIHRDRSPGNGKNSQVRPKAKTD